MLNSGQDKNLQKTHANRKNYMKFFGDISQGSHWLDLHSKQACVHHQHKLQANCCIYIQTKQLYVTNYTTLIRKHDLMLQSCTFMSA